MASQLHRPVLGLLTISPPSITTTAEYYVLLDTLEVATSNFATTASTEFHRQHHGEPLQALAADVDCLAQEAFRKSRREILNAARTAAFGPDGQTDNCETGSCYGACGVSSGSLPA